MRVTAEMLKEAGWKYLGCNFWLEPEPAEKRLPRFYEAHEAAAIYKQQRENER